jgi:hypothetical protein
VISQPGRVLTSIGRTLDGREGVRVVADECASERMRAPLRGREAPPSWRCLPRLWGPSQQRFYVTFKTPFIPLAA